VQTSHGDGDARQNQSEASDDRYPPSFLTSRAHCAQVEDAVKNGRDDRNDDRERTKYQYSLRRARPLKPTYFCRHVVTAWPKLIVTPSAPQVVKKMSPSWVTRER